MDKLTITIRFYEELNYFLKNYPLKTDITFSYKGKRSIKDLIENFGIPHVEVDMILVNGKAVTFNYIVMNGDRISVYPMFERFDIASTSLLRDKPLRTNMFVLDVHLRKLVKNLRLLGFDADYARSRSNNELAEISQKEHRILLTRNRQLVMRNIVQWGMVIRNVYPVPQIAEVLKKLDLWNEIKPFSRCISCNGIIESVPSGSNEYTQIKNRIPIKVQEWCMDFNYCTSCGKIYWKGSHYKKLLDRIGEIHNNIREYRS